MSLRFAGVWKDAGWSRTDEGNGRQVLQAKIVANKLIPPPTKKAARNINYSTAKDAKPTVVRYDKKYSDIYRKEHPGSLFTMCVNLV